LLELGRGIIANLQLEVRSDISVLATSHPELAKQFEELRNLIDLPSPIAEYQVDFDSPYSLDSTNLVAKRRTLVKQFDDLLISIRSLDGFKDFLRGPSAPELYHLAEEGPIIVFNVSDIRSDAFLITTDEIRSIHLRFLTLDSLKDVA
jgi:hypothetical protein